ncbi:GMC oxidoreductase [Aplosporella prunicola CBS 121167]|uniref:GMC oxidoreductase n=1 Tax=Aplosporella prunicola CBS 121167 TaxID=1176127 RepID=A0A6A6AY15_9PEZI|nr:GMC oxidoreductase [Aplosporella prunicola CBS 121167]KAF2136822.1 GMC oxidoreductase [Aplosporella prunicola CBS 121167]
MAGDNVRVWTTLCSIKPACATDKSSTNASSPGARAHAASAYDAPVAHRSNLRVVMGARYEKDGEVLTVAAGREVVLAAGSVNSPQLLELSGIGDAAVLEVKVANRCVSEGLQDYFSESCRFVCVRLCVCVCMMVCLGTYLLACGVEVTATIHELDDSGVASDNDKDKDGDRQKTPPPQPTRQTHSNHPNRGPSSPAPPPTSPSRTSSPSTPSATQLQTSNPAPSIPPPAQTEYISSAGNWSPHFTPLPDKKYGTTLTILQLPFSRGSVHIAPTTDAGGAGKAANTVHTPPRVDPRYYVGVGDKVDLDAMAKATAFGARICGTRPLAGLIKRRVWPPEGLPEGLPERLSEGLAEGSSSASSAVSPRDKATNHAWVRQNTLSDWHPAGTCRLGLGPSSDDGVVDPRLRVQGVAGLRVVDASVMPLRISAHLQATVHAIAEKAAVILAEDLGVWGEAVG